jgi:hypothetical protein
VEQIARVNRRIRQINPNCRQSLFIPNTRHAQLRCVKGDSEQERDHAAEFFQADQFTMKTPEEKRRFDP